MKKNKKNTNLFNNLFIIISYIKSIDVLYLFITTVSVVLNGLIPAIYLVVMQSLINSIQIRVTLSEIINIIILINFINIFQNLFTNFVSYYNTKFSMKFSVTISSMILEKATKLSLSDYENSYTYDLINRAQSEGGPKLISYFNDFFSIISSTITLFSYVIILISFKIWIVLVILALPITKYLLSNKFNAISFNIVKNRTNDVRKSWYISYLLTYGKYFKELKTFNLFNYFIDKYNSYIQMFNSQDLSITRKRTIYFSFISICEIILDGILFLFIVGMGLKRIILIGDVVTYMRTISTTKESITEILLRISNIIKDSLFIDQLFDFFNLEEIDDTNKIEIREINSIEIKNLSYKYQNSKHYTLQNINLIINKNEKIALLDKICVKIWQTNHNRRY